MFSYRAEDIELMPNRITGLNFLIQNNYTIVIFTNQKSTTEKKKNLSTLKLIRAIELLNIPIILCVAFGDNEYRKPCIGMWQKASQLLAPIDKTNSFFCGDAAGRLASQKVNGKKDFSDSDKKFAENIGLPFYVPEQIFK